MMRDTVGQHRVTTMTSPPARDVVPTRSTPRSGTGQPEHVRTRRRGTAPGRPPVLAADDRTYGHPGDDARGAATDDVSLRLAAWLTVVSVEASASTPGQ
jgi:hypothetical protein